MSAIRSLGRALHQLGQQPLHVIHEEATVAKISALVDGISASDLGLVESDYTSRGHDIEYLDVGESEYFTMCVFVLPPGARIPLHDHPDMTVFSKVLFGELECESYDLVSRDKTKADMSLPGRIQSRLLGSSQVSKTRAVVGPKRVDIVRAGEMRTLSPVRGNVHTFLARDKWTAVFDLVMPPYDEDAGRPCTYFDSAGVPVAEPSAGLLQLHQVPCPDWFWTKRGVYKGPSL